MICWQVATGGFRCIAAENVLHSTRMSDTNFTRPRLCWLRLNLQHVPKQCLAPCRSPRLVRLNSDGLSIQGVINSIGSRHFLGFQCQRFKLESARALPWCKPGDV